MRTLLILLLLTPLAWADDVVVCDPTNPIVANSVTSYTEGADSTFVPRTNGYLIWTAPHNLMTEAQKSKMNTLRSQLDSLNGIPLRHWKCIDGDTDGLLDGVTEMTQAQKDLVDAPMLAAQARSQQIDTEKATNDVCNAEPSVLEARIDAAYASASNVSQVKAVTITIMKKMVKCVWARTTSN